MAKKKTNKPLAPKMVFACQYSGPRSADFWREVNATNDFTLYLYACSLQDIEARLLARLNRP